MSYVTGTAVVTGASGFVGANLVRRLLRDGTNVVGLVRADADRWRLSGIADDCELVEVDLMDAPAVKRVLDARRPDVVFHLAAHGGYSWQQDDQAILRTNVLATAILLESARAADVSQFVHAGSSSEYGVRTDAPDEYDALEPNSTYAVGKAAAGWLCRLAHTDAFRTSVLRLYSIYGPYEEPARLIPQLLRAARGNALPPLNDPRTARDFLHVDDCCDAFIRSVLVSSPEPRVLNIGSGSQTTLEELVALTRRLFGVTEEPRWGAYEVRSWDAHTWVARIDRAEAALGWRPTTSLEAGLRETANWLESSDAIRARYEIAS